MSNMNETTYVKEQIDITDARPQLVKVVNIESPGEFWIRLKKYHKEYERIRTIMAIYDLSTNFPVRWNLGMAAAVKSKVDGKWHRCTVTQARGTNEFGVFLVDEGRREIVNSRDMRFLAEKLVGLPWLAINCQLYSYRTTNPQTSQLRYTELEIAHFQNITKGKQLTCSNAIRHDRSLKFTIELNLIGCPESVSWKMHKIHIDDIESRFCNRM